MNEATLYIAEAIKRAGGPSRCAASFGVTVQGVCFYRDGKRPLQPRFASALERMTEGEFVCERLLPDVRWVRVADPAWPWHPKGRPLRDDTGLNIESAVDTEKAVAHG